MNVIETLRSILESFPKISEICNEIHIDFADPEPTSYGLASTGDSLIKEDILGNQTRRHSFMFYSTFSGINDFERISNSGALLELSQWLSTVRNVEVNHIINEKKYRGKITRIVSENGTLYAVPQENTLDGMQYQLQIIVDYTIEF